MQTNETRKTCGCYISFNTYGKHEVTSVHICDGHYGDAVLQSTLKQLADRMRRLEHRPIGREKHSYEK